MEPRWSDRSDSSGLSCGQRWNLNGHPLLQPPLPAQVLQQEALAQESRRVVRDPAQLGVHGLDLLALLRSQIVRANTLGPRLTLAGGVAFN
jgi:hypothetical protein